MSCASVSTAPTPNAQRGWRAARVLAGDDPNGQDRYRALVAAADALVWLLATLDSQPFGDRFVCHHRLLLALVDTAPAYTVRRTLDCPACSGPRAVLTDDGWGVWTLACEACRESWRSDEHAPNTRSTTPTAPRRHK